MAQTSYKRLTRNKSTSLIGVAAVSRRGLWLGPDHLLSLETNGYTETYKRFYFRDIQSFIIQKTQESVVVSVVLTILIVLVAALALSMPNPTFRTVLLVFAGAFGVILMINVLLGPTCRCYLRTAVQVEPLTSLARVRRAQKTLGLVRPFITATQGSETSVPASVKQMQKTETPPAIGPAPAAGGEPAVPPPPDP